MHFVCCIKQVPDTAEVKIDHQTNTLVRAGVESIANPYDMVAVEGALLMKERYGGRVTVLSMGPPQAEAALREALSLGADDAVLLSDRGFAGADTLATSYTLSKAIEKMNGDHPVDVVLCGKQAIDGDTAQTGPGIATRLGYTQLTYVIGIDRIDADERKIQVRRRVQSAVEVIRGPLPALLTVELELGKPRRASLPLLLHSMRTQVTVWDAKAIGAPPEMLGLKGSPTWVRAISSPPPRQGGPMIDAQSDVAGAVSEALDILLADEAFSSELFDTAEA